MYRILIITTLIIVTGCSPKPTPSPARNYKLEALTNDAIQINRFIDNWSGFDQQYSSVSDLREYRAVKNKIQASPDYYRFKGRTEFESKTNQFDAIIKRYEIWVEEREELLDEMDRFSRQYREKQRQLFSAHAKPLVVGLYEIVIANAYYAMTPIDPDQAYASARHIGLKQLDIIAASRDKPLRLPIFTITDFAVDIRITNLSKDRILRPDGSIRRNRGGENRTGISLSGSHNDYLVNFSDDRKNTYQLNRAYGVINKNSENGIRPGESVVWTYSFNPENHPLETVKTFRAAFPKQVFGRALKLSIPMEAITRPKLPPAFQTGS